MSEVPYHGRSCEQWSRQQYQLLCACLLRHSISLLSKFTSPSPPCDRSRQPPRRCRQACLGTCKSYGRQPRGGPGLLHIHFAAVQARKLLSGFAALCRVCAMHRSMRCCCACLTAVYDVCAVRARHDCCQCMRIIVENCAFLLLLLQWLTRCRWEHDHVWHDSGEGLGGTASQLAIAMCQQPAFCTLGSVMPGQHCFLACIFNRRLLWQTAQPLRSAMRNHLPTCEGISQLLFVTVWMLVLLHRHCLCALTLAAVVSACYSLLFVAASRAVPVFPAAATLTRHCKLLLAQALMPLLGSAMHFSCCEQRCC